MLNKEQYLKIMHLKNRCAMFIDDGNKTHALVTFVITDNPKNIERNGVWGLPKENIKGKFIVVDRLISDRNYKIKENIPKLLSYFQTRFPTKQVVWISRGRKNANKEVFAHSS